MKAKELAAILLLDPECEVLVIGNHGGWKKYNRKPRRTKMFLLPEHNEYCLGTGSEPHDAVDCIIL